MPTHNVPQLKSNGWFPSGIPWALAEPRSGPLTDGTYGYEGGNHLHLTVQVPDAFLDQAIQDLVGTNSWNGSTGPANWSRVPPMRHPFKPHYYVSKILSAKPDVFDGKAQSNLPNVPFSAYNVWYLTVLFEQPRYGVMTDADLLRFYGTTTAGGLDETKRFCEIDTRPVDETITLESGSTKWAQGSWGNGAKFNSQWPVLLTKKQVTLRWRRVPTRGLINLTTRQPVGRIQSAYKTVNLQPFLGYPIGTVLLQDWRITPSDSPVDPGVQGLDSLGVFPNLYHDVEFSFTVFDPPNYGTTLTAPSVYGNSNPITMRGHNTAPIPADAKGRWDLVTKDGTTAAFTSPSDPNVFYPFGPTIYGYTDFYYLFVPSIS